MTLTPAEQAELARLEAAFEANGGRGVELAELIDELRAKRERPAGLRTPDDILRTYDDGCRGLADVDMREVLWEVILDVQHSYGLAMEVFGVSTQVRAEVKRMVDDYLTNNYGDD